MVFNMAATDIITQLGFQARAASHCMGIASSASKNKALLAIAMALDTSRDTLIAANKRDLDAGRTQGLTAALLDRLTLSSSSIDAMIVSLQQVAALPDPVGSITDLSYQPSGIQVGRMRVPLGVIGIIYESRPNVTIEAASLCIKSGNASVLRGGSEAQHSNQALAQCITQGLTAAGLPAEAVQVIDTTDRAMVGALLTSPDVDVIIPRGGKSLIERVSREATMEVIKHLDGVCHVYIDKNADLAQAQAIAINAKTQRYGTCNTMETLLIHTAMAFAVLPPLAKHMIELGVELRACDASRAIVDDLIPATEEDWSTEYLAPILSIKIVDSLEAAITHINHYGSQHTDSIVTDDYQRGWHFIRAVDSSSVMINASTRFADGFEYGLGAEIGISTDKLHARGPVGLNGLTSQKFIVLGQGEIRVR